MNFKDTFAINEVEYNKLNDNTSSSHTFILNNYDYYQPKLPQDFYLGYFIHDLLFQIDILELREFLFFHLDNCHKPDDYLSVIDLKVIPIMKDVIKNAEVSWSGRPSGEIELEDGFRENNGIVNKWGFYYSDMKHIAGWFNPKESLVKKISIVEKFMESNEISYAKLDNLKWLGKPSHLAYLVSILEDRGLIDSPKNNNGETNYSQLSRQLKISFNLKTDVKVDSLRRYANPVDEKYTLIKNKLKEDIFRIPNIKLWS
ncbi:hypothetical protein [Winogradskyella schleiferi]|uniref:hypothetical protein n=1 Tax=Winogradskyella schleiferi TaxID=2686078 RepID=UPI0015B91D46|nr:hypothetical protein [Winogradskyella schleiferi]